MLYHQNYLRRMMERTEWKYNHSEEGLGGTHSAVEPSEKDKDVWAASGNLRPKEFRKKPVCLPLAGH